MKGQDPMTTPAPGVWLSRGAHVPGAGEYCLMEHIAVRAGERWTDRPGCVHPVLAAAAIVVNDCLPDKERQQLLVYEDRLMGTARPGKRLAVQLAVWSAQQVLHLCREQNREVCEQAITAAQAWVRAPSRAPLPAAFAAVFADEEARSNYATIAAYAAAYAAHAPSAGGAAVIYAADAADQAARAAYGAGGAGAATAFLDGLIGEYERLTHSEVTA